MGNTGGANMFDVMNRLWRALADDGTITESEYRRTTIPQFYRTPAEFHASLLDPDGPVHRAGLRLVHAETRFTRCPYAARFGEDRDANRFAETYVPNTRTWSETVFVNALDEARPLSQRQAIVDRYFESFRRPRPRGPRAACDGLHPRMHGDGEGPASGRLNRSERPDERGRRHASRIVRHSRASGADVAHGVVCAWTRKTPSNRIIS